MAAPTVELNSPVDEDRLYDGIHPFVFTGTDADADEVEYEVQVDTVDSFNTQTPGSGSSITLVNTSQGSDYSGGSSTNLAVTAASLTAGNFIVVGTRTYTGEKTVTSVTDTAGNTYYKASGRQATYTTTRTEIWYAYNVLGNASNTVTVNMSAGVQYWGVVTAQYSGISKISPLDTTVSGDTATGTTVTSGNFTTTVANELIIAFAEYDSTVGQTWTAGGTYAIQKQDASTVVALEDKIVSSVQTNTTASMTLGTSRNLSIYVATFKSAETAPLLDILSSTDDHANWSGTGDPHPWPSGNQVTYTVPGASALAAGIKYYWRVRAIDPLGGNVYGGWSTTRSFTVDNKSPFPAYKGI
jgi:hypothetical protein